jgi:hypothetical protein
MAIQVHPMGWMDLKDPLNLGKGLVGELMREVGSIFINQSRKRYV